MAQVWVGRCGYSDLKEAAFAGPLLYGSWMGFSWSGGLVAALCGVAEQAESGSGLSSMRSDVWFGDRGGATAEGESGFGRSLGGHAVAWLGFEAGCRSSCGAPVLLWWGARKQLGRAEPLDDAHGSAAEWAPGKGRRCLAAACDRGQHLLMLAVDPSAAAFYEALSGIVDDVGHLHGGAAQALRRASPCDPGASASSGLEVALRCLLDRCR